MLKGTGKPYVSNQRPSTVRIRSAIEQEPGQLFGILTIIARSHVAQRRAAKLAWPRFYSVYVKPNNVH
jgi:hypothetical protein